jgi:adenosylcobinamide-GDP ribazoletransferase
VEAKFEGGAAAPGGEPGPSSVLKSGVGARPRAARGLSPLAGLRVAIGLLTRLPVRWMGGGDLRADLGQAAVWFPVVGALVGGVVGGARALAGTVLGPGPSTVLALAAGILLTGGLHEDGLADTADALGAHVDRARRLEILRDPRVGTFGALALGLALLFSYACLEPMSTAHVVRAALAAHVLARWSPLALARLAPPARPDGLGALLRVSAVALLVASGLAAAGVLAAAGPVHGAVAIALAAAITGGAALAFRRALGGTTGDTFGAAAKLVELGTLAVVAVWWT